MRHKFCIAIFLIFINLTLVGCYKSTPYWHPSMTIDPDFHGCFFDSSSGTGILIVQEPRNLLRGWGLGLGYVEADPEGGHPGEWNFSGSVETVGFATIQTGRLWGEPLLPLNATLQYDAESDAMILQYVRDSLEIGPPRVLPRSTDCPEEWE